MFYQRIALATEINHQRGEKGMMVTEKLQELMLYIAKKSLGDKHFGYVKLNKILFYADFAAYGELGASITNATYIRNHYGPTPREIKAAQASLESAGRAQVVEIPFYERKQQRLIPLAEPDMSLFTSDEIGIVDRMIEEYRNYTGKQLSDQTHELLPWRNSEDGEEIPYYSVFALENIPAGYEDRLWAMQALDELADIDPVELEPLEVDA